MGEVREYSSKLIFNLTSADQAQQAQHAIHQSGFVSPNQPLLTTTLGPLAGVLALVFTKYPASALALSVFSIVAGMTQSAKYNLGLQVNDGFYGLSSIRDYLANNPEYDSLEVNLPFIDFIDEGTRFVTGYGVVTRVHSGTGWIVL